MSDASGDTDLDDFDRALLGAGRGDVPARGAAQRAAAALGVGLTATAPLAAASTATGVAARALAAAGSKWVVVGAFGVMSAGAGTVLLTRQPVHGARVELHRGTPAAPGAVAPATAPKRAEPTPSPREVPPGGPPVAAFPVEAAAGEPQASPPRAPSPALIAGRTAGEKPNAAVERALVAPLSPAVQPPEARAAFPAPSPPANEVTEGAPSDAKKSSGHGVSIAEEVSMVDQARQALRQGRPNDAFAQLKRYQERWPGGVLATEVVVLRVEAELALDEREAARRDARAFIAAQPSSRYAARLRELFEAGELD